MRYYAIRITKAPPLAFPPTPGAHIPGSQFCSVINGVNDPSALRVVFQVEILSMHKLVSQGFIRIYGIDVSMIDQAADLTGAHVEVYGGFWPGLPLASWESRFSGLLFQGTVNGAFGNWKGDEISLEILLMPGPTKDASSGSSHGDGGDAAPSSPDTQGRLVARQRRHIRGSRKSVPPSAAQFDSGLGIPGLDGIEGMFNALGGFALGGPGDSPLKMIHDMKEGMPLDTALKQTLSAAFPNSKITSLIKEGLKLNYHDAGFYQTIGQYLGYAKSLSKDLVKQKGYGGVNLYPVKNMLIAADGTKPYGELQLDYIDLIGQPTWGGKGDDNDVMMVNFMTPMRADIFPPMMVQLPQNTLQYVTPAMGAMATYPRNIRERTTFNGPIHIQTVMIVGDWRNPQGESWALSCSGYQRSWSSGPEPAAAAAPETASPPAAPQLARFKARGTGIGR